jgi:hypothetical protein
MLPDDEIKAILEGTKGGTPGPWTVEMHGPSPVLYSGRSREMHGWNLLRLSDGDWNFNNNAAHIARCDPTTIAELCTRLLAAEARVKVLEDALWRARDGLRWAKIHLKEDAISTAIEMALDQTEATIQERSK